MTKQHHRPAQPFGGSAVLGSFVASGESQSGVAEEARTRGFAAPAFAECALSRDGRLELPGSTRAVKSVPDGKYREPDLGRSDAVAALRPAGSSQRLPTVPENRHGE